MSEGDVIVIISATDGQNPKNPLGVDPAEQRCRRALPDAAEIFSRYLGGAYRTIAPRSPGPPGPLVTPVEGEAGVGGHPSKRQVIVIEASAMVDALVGEPANPTLLALLADEELHAPALLVPCCDR